MDIKKFDLSRLSGNRTFDPELIDYEDSIDIIGDEIHSVRKSFVKMGWYLKHIREKEMYRRDGYEDIFECAHAKFKMSEGTVNRMINLCIEFSVGHDSPELDERYQEFSESQLFEMLPMKESERDEISPDMTVKEIRDKKAENRAMKEPPERLVWNFLKGRGIDLSNYGTLQDLKKSMVDTYGKSYTSGDSPCKFECTPRGISLKSYDEVTWLTFAKKAWGAGADPGSPKTARAEPAEISKIQDTGAEDKTEAAIAVGINAVGKSSEEPVESEEEAVISENQDCTILMNEAYALSLNLCEGFRFSTQNHTLSQIEEYVKWSERLNAIAYKLWESYK